MTNTLLSPSRIAARVLGRYHTGDGDPPPTHSVSPTFDRQKHIPYYKATVVILPHSELNQRRGDYSTVVSVPNRIIRAYIDAKSP